MRLLIVEDDDRVSAALRAALNRFGFQVFCALTASAALELLGRTDPDLILLDIGLPDGDGLQLCREIRRVSDVAIIMTTARSQIASRVAGLTQGADDYLVKPYNLAELVARIHAIDRRRTRSSAGAGAAGPDGGSAAAGTPGRAWITLGPLRIDLDAWSARIDEDTLALTRKEFDLLVLLARHPDQVLPHGRLVDELWSEHRPPNARRTLHVHISALRGKLGHRCPIETVHGVGYRLVDAGPRPR
jgi:DNA-binding response OmpR family regulator